MPGRAPGGLGRLAVPTTVGVVGLVLIGIGQTVPNRHSIEHDLTTRSAQALQSADLTGLTVSFTGRDATITGAGPTDLGARAEDVVGSVNGVRVAKAELTAGSAAVPAPAAPPTEAPTPVAADTAAPTDTTAPADSPSAAAEPATVPVGFTLAGGTLTVTGTVQSEAARAALIAASEGAGSGWTVVDRLAVNGSLAPPAPTSSRLPALTRLLAQAPVGGSRLVIQYSASTVILRGAPATTATERALLTAAAKTVSSKANVIDGLDVTAS